MGDKIRQDSPAADSPSCSGDKFVVSSAEEAYHVPESQPNQKFRLSIKRSTK
jgi:hypothetical protein